MPQKKSQELKQYNPFDDTSCTSSSTEFDDVDKDKKVKIPSKQTIQNTEKVTSSGLAKLKKSYMDNNLEKSEDYKTQVNEMPRRKSKSQSHQDSKEADKNQEIGSTNQKLRGSRSQTSNSDTTSSSSSYESSSTNEESLRSIDSIKKNKDKLCLTKRAKRSHRNSDHSDKSKNKQNEVQKYHHGDTCSKKEKNQHTPSIGQNRKRSYSQRRNSGHVGGHKFYNDCKRSRRRSRVSTISKSSISSNASNERKLHQHYSHRRRRYRSRTPSSRKSYCRYRHSAKDVKAEKYKYNSWAQRSNSKRKEPSIQMIEHSRNTILPTTNNALPKSTCSVQPHKMFRSIKSHVVVKDTDTLSQAYTNRDKSETTHILTQSQTPFNIHSISTTNVPAHSHHQHGTPMRHNKTATRTNLIEIIPSIQNDNNTLFDNAIGELQKNENSIEIGQPQLFRQRLNNDQSSVNFDVETYNTRLDDGHLENQLSLSKTPLFKFGGLSDCFLEEMLQEEELKRVEESLIQEKQIADEEQLTECQSVLQCVIDVIWVVNDRLCHVPSLESRLAPMKREVLTRHNIHDVNDASKYKSSKRSFKVVPWLCNLNSDDLKRINEEAAKSDDTIRDKHIKSTDAQSDLTVKQEMQSLEITKANCSPLTVKSYDQPTAVIDSSKLRTSNDQATDNNDIDSLLEIIFTARAPKQETKKIDKIASWIASTESTASINATDYISDGDEPYDPEVEEERLQMQKRREEALNNCSSSLSKRIDMLFVKDQPVVSAQEHNARIEEYRQKKIRMEQVAAIAKAILKPIFLRRDISKEDYKIVIKRTVDKYTRSKDALCKEKIAELIEYNRNQLRVEGKEVTAPSDSNPQISKI